MAGLSDFAEAYVLDDILTNAPFWIGLHTADAADDNSGAECVGTSYVRMPVTLTRSGNVLSNSVEVAFPEATTAWGIISHGAVYDAVSSGNQWMNGTALYSKDTSPGDTVLFPIGTLTFTLD